MNDVIETEVQDAAAAEIQKKFDEQEEYFQKTVRTQAVLRAFFEKHRETIAPFKWRAYGWCDTEIEFQSYSKHPMAKEIANAFGKNGWRRVPNRHSCGAIDWRKDLDGCVLIIKTAEQLEPKVIEEVKL